MDVYSWLRRSLSRPRKGNSPSTPNCPDKKQRSQEDEEEMFGVTDRLIDFVKTFTVDTFKDVPLRDEEGANSDDGALATTGNVQMDLSEWQERHATLMLSKVKEMSQLRFKLCPRHLKERQFWRIYFTLVKSYTAQYELRAIQLEKLRQMAIDNPSMSNMNMYEVEMSETKQLTNEGPSASLEEDLNSPA
ncbi:hypothetical protein NMG60_11034535 [Bertholletia excelsa]